MGAEIFYPVCARIPSPYGEFQLCIYLEDENSKEHLGLTMGNLEGKDNVLVRVHSECFTGDVLGSLRCDCGEQLQRAMSMISEAGEGAIIYLRQEGRGIGLQDKLRAYNLQDEGYDTVDANLALGHQADERDYSSAARILAHLSVRSINLITNNPSKIKALTSLGVDVRQRIPLIPTINPENVRYISAKIERMSHLLDKTSLKPEPDDTNSNSS